ncbi:MAG: hypothetical protein HRU09_11500 [Oligoflexales bacterium]|nr:hypothetical protein [Oligoflexales bacterium]
MSISVPQKYSYNMPYLQKRQIKIQDQLRQLSDGIIEFIRNLETMEGLTLEIQG